MQPLRVALAQINSTVGDLEGNLEKIRHTLELGREQSVDLIAFPELAITGYPPEDLLLKPRFIEDSRKALDTLVTLSRGFSLIVGFVDQNQALYNAAALIHEGQLALIHHKWCLPNYGVFDENRYFTPGKQPTLFELKGRTIGVNICEDIWSQSGPTSTQAEAGADLIININASPYHLQKSRVREELLSKRALENGVQIVYVNMVGGQDELVFDGGSLVYDERGRLLARAAQFEEAFLVIDLPAPSGRSKTKTSGGTALDISKTSHPCFGEKLRKKRAEIPLPKRSKNFTPEEEIYRALVMGVSDYVKKNQFNKGVIGLSGGVDSALTAVIAADALGKDNVVGVFMPSRYSSEESRVDAEGLAQNLGIAFKTLSIEDPFQASLALLSETFQGRQIDVTEENLQSRIRGNLLMALSNKFGWLVLTTGNKSEFSVGYATLYGDMAGGFAVIKDLWKTTVYRLAMMRNKKRDQPIPLRILEKAPTAELRPNQKDEDSLPPYDMLDPILEAYVEEHKSAQDIVSMGYAASIVSKVISLVDRSEFKRRQAPVGIKITSRALGKDRRMPITNRYRGFYKSKTEHESATTEKKRRMKIA